MAVPFLRVGSDAIGRYALNSLRRMRGAVADDLTALDQLPTRAAGS
jgi:hypothetical protein